MSASSSITIQREIEVHGGKRAGVTGSGENTCILWELGDGRRVIETNGDPVWEGEPGFEDIAADCK